MRRRCLSAKVPISDFFNCSKNAWNSSWQHCHHKSFHIVDRMSVLQDENAKQKLQIQKQWRWALFLLLLWASLWSFDSEQKTEKCGQTWVHLVSLIRFLFFFCPHSWHTIHNSWKLVWIRRKWTVIFSEMKRKHSTPPGQKVRKKNGKMVIPRDQNGKTKG